MKDPRRMRNSWGIFRWPLLLNLIALAGILAALIGNDGWDVFSWITLGGTAVLISLTTAFRRCNPVD